ncbi:MAG: 4Fe-4S binding protein [Promethearchaeota archaeon]
MTVNDEVYAKLREQINKMPIGFPSTESGVEIHILMQLFTPDEAQIALHLNIITESVNKIYQRIKKSHPTISLEDVETTLERLALKGVIRAKEKDGKKAYGYLQFAIGMFEYQVDRMTKGFFENCENYLYSGFKDEFYRTKIPQLRPVPIGKSLPTNHPIAIYDDIRNIIKQTDGEFGVMNCICKQGKDLIGTRCQVTEIRETCILFPNPTSYFRKLEISRPVSKEEVLEILEQAEKASLVIQPENTLDPKFICCCCGDCCGVLSMAKTYSKPSQLFSSNYHAKINSNNCKGCASCLKHCQMEALVLKNGKTSVDLDRCIGCGICINKCPNKAIILKKKNKIVIPPKNQYELYRKILIKKLGPINTLKTGIKMKLRMKI